MEEEWPMYTVSLMFQDTEIALLSLKKLPFEYCLTTVEYKRMPWREEDLTEAVKLYDLVFDFTHVDYKKGKQIHVYKFAGVREHAADC